MKKILNIMVLSTLMACLVPANAQDFTQKRMETQAIQSQKMMPAGVTYNGTVYEPFSTTTPSAYSPATTPGAGGPRRSGEYPGWHQNENGEWVPDNVEEYGSGAEYGQSSQFPIGDAVLPMLAFALMFCGYVAVRRKRAVNG